LVVVVVVVGGDVSERELWRHAGGGHPIEKKAEGLPHELCPVDVLELEVINQTVRNVYPVAAHHAAFLDLGTEGPGLHLCDHDRRHHLSNQSTPRARTPSANIGLVQARAWASVPRGER